MAVSLGGAWRGGLDTDQDHAGGGHKHWDTRGHLEALAGALPRSKGAPGGSWLTEGGTLGLPKVTLMG